MYSYSGRKKIEQILRKFPDFISNFIINSINPVRKKIIKNNIHPKWITLFITNYCSARCEHCFYSKELNNKVEELNLENLTTEHSYELDADHISLRINHTLRFSEKSKIVALFDPVGRQKDIALAHAQLCILQQAESAQNVYPYTIGSFVQALRSSKDEEIKEALAENINWQEHGNYWQAMDKSQQTYLARQQEFVELYTAFMRSSEHQNQVGSLNTYFKSFFAEPQQNTEIESEFVKLCDLFNDMLSGMSASEPGNKALEKLFIEGAEQAENNENSSPIAIFFYHFLRPIVTQPQKGTDFTANTLQVLDGLMLTIAPTITKLYFNFSLLYK